MVSDEPMRERSFLLSMMLSDAVYFKVDHSLGAAQAVAQCARWKTLTYVSKSSLYV